MIKHLRVADSKAQETKIFLEELKALNELFLPIKEKGYILWPLNFEVEGEIIECEGRSSTRISRDYRLRLPLAIREIAPRAFDIFGDIAIIKLSDLSMEHSKIISKTLLESHTNINKVALDLGVKGDYRIRDLEMLIGDSNFVATQKENGFEFRLDISKSMINQVSEISEVTINKCYKKIDYHKDQLIPQKIRNKYNCSHI